MPAQAPRRGAHAGGPHREPPRAHFIAPAPAGAEPFALREGSPFIELQHLLKVVGACDSGGGAKFAIQAGEVVVNGVVETRRSRKLVTADVVEHGGRAWRVVAVG